MVRVYSLNAGSRPYTSLQVEELRSKGLVSSGKIDELLIDAFREDIAFGLEEDDQEGEIID